MALEIRTATELTDPELDARWTTRRAAREGCLTAHPAHETRSAMSAVLTGEREQVDSKPPKRQPAVAHEDRAALNEDSPFPAPRRRCRPASPRGLGASLLVQLQDMQDIESVSEGRDLGAALPHGATHERPGVGRGVARLVRVRRRESRPDLARVRVP